MLARDMPPTLQRFWFNKGILVLCGVLLLRAATASSSKWDILQGLIQEAGEALERSSRSQGGLDDGLLRLAKRLEEAVEKVPPGEEETDKSKIEMRAQNLPRLLERACQRMLGELERQLYRAVKTFPSGKLRNYYAQRADLYRLMLESRHGESIPRVGTWLAEVAAGRRFKDWGRSPRGRSNNFGPVRKAWVVDRIGSTDVSRFRAKYQGQSPVVLTGLAETWPARKKWKLNYLKRKIGRAVVKAVFPERSDGWVNEIAVFNRETFDCTVFPQGKQRKDFRHLVGKWAIIRPPSAHVRMADVLSVFSNGSKEVPIYVNQLNMFEGLEPLLEDLGDLRIHISHAREPHHAKDLFLTNAPAVVGLHYDNDDNFMTVLKGTKEVIMYPPEQHKSLYNNPLVHLSVDFSPEARRKPCRFIVSSAFNRNHCEVNELRPDTEGGHPMYAKANGTVVTVHEGETVYIPAKWFHAIRTTPAVDGGFALAANAWLPPPPARTRAQKAVNTGRKPSAKKQEL